MGQLGNNHCRWPTLYPNKRRVMRAGLWLQRRTTAQLVRIRLPEGRIECSASRCHGTTRKQSLSLAHTLSEQAPGDEGRSLAAKKDDRPACSDKVTRRPH